jgi:predicted acetyltransferase
VAAIETEFGFRFEPVGRHRHELAVDNLRSLAVFEQRSIVATLSAYVVEISLPGGVHAAATALVDIGVVPERRGLGLARALVAAFCSRARDRGETLAVLNTDVTGLYERFGFGVATTEWSATVPLRRATPLPGSDRRGQVRLIEVTEAQGMLPEIFASLRQDRVGEVLRTSQWWEEHFADATRVGAPMEFAVIERDGDVRGYVAFVRASAQSGLVVVELVVTDDGSSRELLEFVGDLTDGGPIRLRAQPLDALDERAADREASPQLWLRVLDVPRALSLRRYAAASRTVLAMRDELLEANCGRFLLETHADGTASVTPSNDEAAIALDVGVLGRVFLGGSTFSELATSGEIVVGDASALASIDRAFATTRMPFCSTLL